MPPKAPNLGRHVEGNRVRHRDRAGTETGHVRRRDQQHTRVSRMSENNEAIEKEIVHDMLVAIDKVTALDNAECVPCETRP